MQQHDFDVVVVGAGGAGLRAALQAGEQVRTAVVTKLYPVRSPTGGATGGIAAALGNVDADSWEWHAFDTVNGGDYLVDQDAAEVMCREAADAVRSLENLGLPFNRSSDGRIDQRRFGGHTREHGQAPLARSSYAADRIGQMLLQTLCQQCLSCGVEFFNEFHLLDLLFETDAPDAPVAGIVAYELATGELHVFAAKSVVLATGGFGKVFRTTSNAHTVTGDGMAVALRRGLPLADMEFYQFHPTGLPGLGIALSESARVEGGLLRNGAGERFMQRYAPIQKDVAPADVVCRAIVSEVRAGRGCGPRGDHVLLDLTHLPRKHIEPKVREILEFARTYLDIDACSQPVPVFPTAHYAMGGIPTTVDAQVLRGGEHVVPGLFAAGEVACVSVHGANRLPTNSLLETSVFGRRAGRAAADYAGQLPGSALLPAGPADYVEAMLGHARQASGSERVAPIRAALQQTMDEHASVYRTETSLRQAGEDIARLQERYRRIGITDRGTFYNTELMEAIELGFLLDLAEVLVASAAARTESRGAHFREDFPQRDDANFLRHTMAYRAGSPDARIRLDYRPVTVTRYSPAERVY